MDSKVRWSLVPLRMIRIAKNISVNDMAKYFEVTPTYINAIENGNKTMRSTTLKYGLIGLNISFEDYTELEEFSNFLNNIEMDLYDKYKYMLMKTCCILCPEEREATEEYLNKVLSTKTK